MSKIKIQNFGPIKEGRKDNDGWIDIKKVTVFIGNQGSGKSTIAKLISTFTWLEKVLTRGDWEDDRLKKLDTFKNLLSYHKLQDYLKERTSIEYLGESLHISYQNNKIESHKAFYYEKRDEYHLPQIMYVPAERNFISNVNTKALRLTSESLKDFVVEYFNACEAMNDQALLPINDVKMTFDKASNAMHINGSDYTLKLAEASSGLQSFVPLYIVSKFLSDAVKTNKGVSMTSEQRDLFVKRVNEIENDINYNADQKRILKSLEAKKFNKSAFINIVEEPEQNLFPSSQWEMLQSLLQFNNELQSNKLIITTHSPYTINYLSIAIYARKVLDQIKDDKLRDKLANIIHLESTIQDTDTAIYQLDEKDGTVSLLGDYKGIPSDQNFLNNSLREGNQKFDLLLEIEEAL